MAESGTPPLSPAASSGPARSVFLHAAWGRQLPRAGRAPLPEAPAGVGPRDPEVAGAEAGLPSSAAASPGPAGTPCGERQARLWFGEVGGESPPRRPRATKEEEVAARPGEPRRAWGCCLGFTHSFTLLVAGWAFSQQRPAAGPNATMPAAERPPLHRGRRAPGRRLARLLAARGSLSRLRGNRVKAAAAAPPPPPSFPPSFPLSPPPPPPRE